MTINHLNIIYICFTDATFTKFADSIQVRAIPFKVVCRAGRQLI